MNDLKNIILTDSFKNASIDRSIIFRNKEETLLWMIGFVMNYDLSEEYEHKLQDKNYKEKQNNIKKEMGNIFLR